MYSLGIRIVTFPQRGGSRNAANLQTKIYILRTKRGEGVQISQNSVDVIYGCPRSVHEAGFQQQSKHSSG